MSYPIWPVTCLANSVAVSAKTSGNDSTSSRCCWRPSSIRKLTRGTCYKAAGWVELGRTAGFAKHASDYYVPHDRPKRIFVRELSDGAGEELCAERTGAAQQAGLNRVEPTNVLGAPECQSLFECFRKVPDPRSKRRQYPIGSLLGICAAAMLSGIGSMDGLGRFARRLSKAQRNRLRLPKNKKGEFRVPCANTFRYLFERLDTDAFDRQLGGVAGEPRVDPGRAALY